MVDGIADVHASISVSWPLSLIFSDDVLDPANVTLAQLVCSDASTNPCRVMVFVDQGLEDAGGNIVAKVVAYFGAHTGRVLLVGQPRVVLGGEQAKRDTDVLDQCIEALYGAHLDRHSYVIAVGGGAVLDVICFAASIVHRGLRQIRIPTTVLAQSDAGIGIKNGVNYRGLKNFLGSFYPPQAVINDMTLLRTLPWQGWRDGTAEAVKVALIRDAAFFEWIEAHVDRLAARNEPAMRHLIQRCAQLHFSHIATAGDPFEHGSARPLDFGHWAAHKLEQMSDGAVSHGHAVAIGIAIDSLYSNRIGLLDDQSTGRILNCLRRLGFRFDIAATAGIRHGTLGDLLQGIRDFQEHLGGQLCLTLLRAVGSGTELNALDTSVMKECCGAVLFGDEGPGQSTSPRSCNPKKP